jgi:hypothetical protein
MQDGNQNPTQPPPRTQLDDVATKELEKLLSIPLDEMALGVLNLEHYADLIGFLPWANRRQVALTMLKSVSNAGTSPESVKEIEELFSVIAPVLRDEHDAAPTTHAASYSPDAVNRTANLMATMGVSPSPAAHNMSFSQQGSSFQEIEFQEDAAIVSKLIHLLDHSDTDVLFEMLTVARNHLNSGKRSRTNKVYSALVFASLKLAKRILAEEMGEPTVKEEEKTTEAEAEKQAENGGEEPKEEAVEAKEEVAEENEKPGEEKEEEKTTEAESEKQAENGGEEPKEEAVEAKEEVAEENEKPGEEEKNDSGPAKTEEKPPKSVRYVFLLLRRGVCMSLVFLTMFFGYKVVAKSSFSCSRRSPFLERAIQKLGSSCTWKLPSRQTNLVERTLLEKRPLGRLPTSLFLNPLRSMRRTREIPNSKVDA